MSAGHARAAIREMIRLPRPGRRWSVAWTVAAGIGVVAAIFAAVLGPLDPRGSGSAVVAAGVVVAILGKVLGRLNAWLVVTTGISLLLGAIPLFGVLGFELAVPMAL